MDDIVSRAVSVANSQPEVLRLADRKKQLSQMIDSLIIREGDVSIGHCDDCCQKRFVAKDPDSDCEFMLCLECATVHLKSTVKRLNKEKQRGIKQG